MMLILMDPRKSVSKKSLIRKGRIRKGSASEKYGSGMYIYIRPETEEFAGLTSPTDMSCLEVTVSHDLRVQIVIPAFFICNVGHQQPRK
jgi:hypothetical protein